MSLAVRTEATSGNCLYSNHCPNSKDRELLILKPLSKLEAGSLRQPLILVIDALDECDDDSDIKQILRLLSEAGQKPRFDLAFVKCQGFFTKTLFFTKYPEGLWIMAF